MNQTGKKKRWTYRNPTPTEVKNFVALVATKPNGMPVSYLSGNFKPLWGGKIRVRSLIEEAAKRGHPIEVLEAGRIVKKRVRNARGRKRKTIEVKTSEIMLRYDFEKGKLNMATTKKNGKKTNGNGNGKKTNGNGKAKTKTKTKTKAKTKAKAKAKTTTASGAPKMHDEDYAELTLKEQVQFVLDDLEYRCKTQVRHGGTRVTMSKTIALRHVETLKAAVRKVK